MQSVLVRFRGCLAVELSYPKSSGYFSFPVFPSVRSNSSSAMVFHELVLCGILTRRFNRSQAQTWVDKMSASDQDEPKAKDFEGRPPGYNQFNELNFFFLAFLDI